MKELIHLMSTFEELLRCSIQFQAMQKLSEKSCYGNKWHEFNLNVEKENLSYVSNIEPFTEAYRLQKFKVNCMPEQTRVRLGRNHRVRKKSTCPRISVIYHEQNVVVDLTTSFCQGSGMKRLKNNGGIVYLEFWKYFIKHLTIFV